MAQFLPTAEAVGSLAQKNMDLKELARQYPEVARAMLEALRQEMFPGETPQTSVTFPPSPYSRIFINVREGKLQQRNGEENLVRPFIEGYVTNITQRQRTFNNETVTMWNLDIKNHLTGETFTLSLPYASGLFKSIVLSLASVDGLAAISAGAPIRISTYRKDGFNRAVVGMGNNRLAWVTKELPPCKELMIGGRVVKDDSERMDAIKGFVAKILAARPAVVPTVAAAQPVAPVAVEPVVAPIGTETPPVSPIDEAPFSVPDQGQGGPLPF